MTKRYLAGAAALILLLSACVQTEREKSGIAEIGPVAKLLFKRNAAPAAQPGAEPSRAELASFGVPIIEVGSAGGTIYLVPMKTAPDGARIWATANQQTMTFRGDQIVMTRGFGASDLIQASVPSSLRQSGAHERRYTTLDGADQAVTAVLSCRVTGQSAETITIRGRAHQTTRLRETCNSAGKVYENDYWLDASGIRKMHQFMGDAIGYVTVSRVID